MRFHVRTNVLGEGQNYSYRGGEGNQYATYGDVNGDGAAEICWLKPIGWGVSLTGHFKLTCKNALTGLQVKRFNVGRVYGQPFPLRRHSGEAVYFAFPRRNRGEIWVKIINSQGQSVGTEIVFSGEGKLLPFSLSADEPELLGFVKDQQLTLYNLDTGERSNVAFPAGRAVSGFNAGYFDATIADCQCTSR